jgi:hypothetical protein
MAWGRRLLANRRLLSPEEDWFLAGERLKRQYKRFTVTPENSGAMR